MINSWDELSVEVFEATRGVNGWDDSRIDYLSQIIKVYMQAEVNALSRGFVGVGCITFAENTIKRWQEENPYETWKENTHLL